MKLANTRTMNNRRARHALDTARNPKHITDHACERWIEDTAFDKRAEKSLVDRSLSMIEHARREIRKLCQAATDIRRTKNCKVLTSGDWFVFYRDGAIITVMHRNSARRWPN